MKRIAPLLEILSATVIGAALLRVIAGPLRFDILGAPLSVRSLSRPFLIAALLIAARVWLEPAQQRIAGVGLIAGRVLTCAIVCSGVLGWMTYLSATCGGADSYGYVSAAERLVSGRLVQVEPLARVLPFSDAILAATPLGYTPSVRIADASVPVYPLGLPALMAAAITFIGHQGPFVVAPLMGVVLLIGVYQAAYSSSRDRLLALTATAMTAVHPVVFTYSIQPMSDVPAAAFFLAAVAALVHQPAWPVVAGGAAALCLLIRPALGPALAALAFIPMIAQRRADVPSAVRYAIPLACGVLLQLGTQWYLYGHPLANGYADMGTLFSVERIGINARSHSYWAWHSLGPLFLGSAALGMVLIPSTLRIMSAMVITMVALPYLAYRTFDHWETLRFLLPALVVLTIPAAAGVLGVGRRVAGASGGALLAALLVLALGYWWTVWLRVNNVFTMPDHEARHRAAGELVSQTAPANTVVLAQQHSGSIRYYSHRASANWDRIPAGAMPATVSALQQAGYSVYLLIDSDEERAAFESRHGPTAGWLPSGQRRNVQLFEARRPPSPAER